MFTKTFIPVSRAPVLVTTFKNPPKIRINTPTSAAFSNPLIGAIKKSENLARTTPLPLTIFSPSNEASGSKYEIIAIATIINIIIVNEDNVNFFFLAFFAIFISSYKIFLCLYHH